MHSIIIKVPFVDSVIRLLLDPLKMGNSVSIPALPYIPHNKPPPTVFAIKCYPKADEVCRELDSFFLKHWPFKDQKERNRFFASQTNRWACYALPLVRDDRIIDSVKVNTLLFLLDGWST